MSAPAHKTYGQPCRCHLPSQGHHYDENLRCVNGGCFTTWYDQQEHPTECKGLWAQQGRREEEES